MVTLGLSNRVRAVGLETLHHLSPLKGLFVSFRPDSPPSLQEAVADVVHAIRSSNIQISDPLRQEEVIAQIKDAHTAGVEAANDIKDFVCKETPLSKDHIAILHMYSQQSDPDGEDSLYALINAVLRNSDRSQVKAIRSFVFLFMTAIKECPTVETRVVFRGVVGDISGEYQIQRTVVWHQASSCTMNLEVLNNPIFLGTAGQRTIFNIELGPTSRARRISEFSSFPTEAEVILPPNTRLKVTMVSPSPSLSPPPPWGLHPFLPFPFSLPTSLSHLILFGRT
jgi:hypothetical protein